MTALHPRGTVRARFESTEAVDAVFRRLGIGAQRCDLGDQGLYLAEELVAADRWLGGSDPEALGFLVLALMIALRQGSTRLPLDGPGKGQLRSLVADIVKLAELPPEDAAVVSPGCAPLWGFPRVTGARSTPEGVRSEVDLRAGRAAEPVLATIMKRIAHLTGAPSFNSVIGSRDARLPLVVDDGCLYTERMRHLEVRVATKLAARLTAPAPRATVALDDVVAELTPDQRHAVAMALSGRLSVITGGPGTGKTRVAAAIVRGLSRAGIADIAVAAPTGRAANRLGEVLSGNVATPAPVIAQTIHRLLGYRGHTVVHHAGNPLAVGALLIDEASMIDLELMAAVLDALPETAPLVLLGDAHQLPAIDAGRVLADLVSLQSMGVSRIAALEHSHRMDAADSRGRHILEAARAIQSGSGNRLTERHKPLAVAKTPGTLRFSGVEWVDAGAGALVSRHGDNERLNQASRAEAEAPRRSATGRSARSGNDGIRDGSPQSIGQNPCGEVLVARHVTEALWHHFDGAKAQRIANDTIFRFDAGAIVAAQAEQLRALWDLLSRARVLTATRGLPTGAIALNAHLHSLLLARMTVTGQPEFLPGEPVMITANDYQRGLWNGDQGMIVRADEGQGHHRFRAVFRVGGNLVPFAIEALRDRLEHAWALTIHKSQGSEFDAVAIVLPDDDVPVLTRELLYTAVTRARTSVVLCGSRSAVHSGANRPALRDSGLATRICAMLAT